MNGSRLIVVMFVLIVVIPIAFLAVKYGGGPTALSPEQALAEYRTEAVSLTLAPGWKWPSSPIPSHALDGSAIIYEKGWGKQEADFYWFCSHTSQAIDRQLPAAERQQALEHVLSIQTKYFYTTALADDFKSSFDQMLQNAANDNIHDLGRFYELNCPKGP